MSFVKQAPRGVNVIFVLMGTLVLTGPARADLVFTVDLQGGVGDSPMPPYITYQSPIQDANGDGWNETVLKITLNGSPYTRATFLINYAAPPDGMSVNIGDSSTNNGFGGDAATQSNDAEINIGNVGSSGDKNTLYVFGNDKAPVNPNPLAQIPGFVGSGVSSVTLGVANDFFSWDNHQGSAGNLTSPYLYALAGQPDTEGPVNYDIYAAFNESVSGIGRPGTGVGRVTVILSVPEPTSLGLLGVGIGLSVWQRRRAWARCRPHRLR